ncbi:MAG: hypothetical protein MRJ68_11070 [Nitrospira sp.]|nr:hypothetical protein [Nitrospira sp.]
MINRAVSEPSTRRQYDVESRSANKRFYPHRVDDRRGDHRDLAAIRHPNFLQYQMKSRQSQGKTNLGAIKTSEVSWQGERGCFLVVAAAPAVLSSIGN